MIYQRILQKVEEEEKVNTGQVKKLTHIFEEMGKEEKVKSHPTDTESQITEDQAKSWHKKHRILTNGETLQKVMHNDPLYSIYKGKNLDLSHSPSKQWRTTRL